MPLNLVKDLNTDYFKKVLSTSKIKYYLNIDLKDFVPIVDDILISMKIRDFFASQIFKYKIANHPEIFYNGNSVSFNLINTVRDDINQISYGSLYINKNENKYSLIFSMVSEISIEFLMDIMLFI